MRVVFLGTPATAVPALTAILEAGHEVPLVVTQPDRPAGRSREPQPPPVKSAAAARGIGVVQPAGVRGAAFAGSLAAARPDVLAVVAFGRILPRAVLDAAPLGAINVHFSLLPELRGAAPVQWALARGAIETGVTTFRLDEGLDTGDVILQERVAIERDEHAPALLERLAARGAALLVETLAGLAAGTLRPVPQDHARATAAPILRREDGFWRPAWSASEIEGRVRGFDPWPGVWARRAGKRLRLVDVAALREASTETPSGTVFEGPAAAMFLACAGGSVAEIRSVQIEGRRPMTAREARHGRQISPGDRLECFEPPA